MKPSIHLRRRAAPRIGIALVLLIALALAWPWLRVQLYYLTGEEKLLPQTSGLVQYVLTRLQPSLQTADMVPVQHADLPPYGVNTFLQNEVEPAKREEAMRLLAEAGFRWIRQEFPWEDIEVHGKGDFEDRRHEPHRPAWEKYDHIVDLAEKYDVQIMARLSNPPAWSRAQGNQVGAFAPPDNLKDYGDFVEAVARRYRGRIHAYQVWNEPNIFPEWGLYPISAEEYAALLKEGYTRIKAVDPEAIVVMGALAATIELDRQHSQVSPGGLSDVLFLQQLYDAGGGPYFDVLAMQGYGLWSGPYDRRMQPRVLNFSRPLYVRDVMVRNGDAHKPIWLSELAWNAVPDDAPNKAYGQVTPEQQGRYAVEAYRRLQREWPWLGVGFYWFLKQADDREKLDGNPQYYFRLLDPDFSPQPVYHALQEANNQPPLMYRGWHQEDHWAITYSDGWQQLDSEAATLGRIAQTDAPGAEASFIFYGSHLTLVGLAQPGGGRLQVQVDDEEPVTVDLGGDGVEPRRVSLNATLPQAKHRVRLVARGDGPVAIDGFIVQDKPSLWLNRLGSALMVLAALGGVVALASNKWQV
ncbi:MAG: hypothetical protein ACE5H9_10715 [Anaerolineae bacterium]